VAGSRPGTAGWPGSPGWECFGPVTTGGFRRSQPAFEAPRRILSGIRSAGLADTSYKSAGIPGPARNLKYRTRRSRREDDHFAAELRNASARNKDMNRQAVEEVAKVGS